MKLCSKTNIPLFSEHGVDVQTMRLRLTENVCRDVPGKNGVRETGVLSRGTRDRGSMSGGKKSVSRSLSLQRPILVRVWVTGRFCCRSTLPCNRFVASDRWFYTQALCFMEDATCSDVCL